MVSQRLAWRQRQVEALGGKCEKCGSTENLKVHHKDFDFTNNSPENLELLCASCHKKAHEKDKVWQKGVTMRARGIIREDGRITIPIGVREELGIVEDVFYELEIYGDDKILITIIG